MFRRAVRGLVGGALSVLLIAVGIVLVFADAQDRLQAATRVASQAEVFNQAPVSTAPLDVARLILVDSVSMDGPMPKYSIVFVDAAGFRTMIDDPDTLVFVEEGGYQYVSYGSFGAMGTGSPVPLPRPWIPRLVTGVLAAGLTTALATGAYLALTWPGRGGRATEQPERARGRARRARPAAP